MKQPLPESLDHAGYWIALSTGAIAGAYFFGSLNLSLPGLFKIGHSLAGALLGAVIAVESYKFSRRETRSTGFAFVIPITVGIIIGRLGCHFSGFQDQTFGIPTTLPWAVDMGDGILRHPVALYESADMLLFLVVISIWRAQKPARFRSMAFYLFALFYSVQRFALEFLKPYPKVWGPFNLFHLVCAAIAVYAFAMLGRAHANGNAASTPN